MTRERPKQQVKVLATEPSGVFKALIRSLLDRQGGHKTPVISQHPTAPADPRRVFDQKGIGKKGGWRKWELEKIWGPHFDKDGKIFTPQSSDSRQQKRRRELKEAFAYMAEHYGGEPRRIRRSMARDKLKNFRKLEREMSAQVAG